MRAMLLEKVGSALVEASIPSPRPESGEVLIKIDACAVCRTDLHVIDGDLKQPKLPLVLGHEIVGEVVETGPSVKELTAGDRVGVPWLGGTCGACLYCQRGQENLCDKAVFTGYQKDGGFAEYTVADERFAFRLPREFDEATCAPLLCAGLIGWRSLRMAGDGMNLGVYGFGAAAHILAQIAHYQGRKVFALTRPGDAAGQSFARGLGVYWAGGSDQMPPEPLDAAIIFAPVGALVPAALQAVRKGGVVVCGGIHMSDIPSFGYDILWGERCLRSVANLTRQDALEFFAAAASAKVKTSVRPYPLAKANEALADLRWGRLHGAAVLLPDAL